MTINVVIALLSMSPYFYYNLLFIIYCVASAAVQKLVGVFIGLFYLQLTLL